MLLELARCRSLVHHAETIQSSTIFLVSEKKRKKSDARRNQRCHQKHTKKASRNPKKEIRVVQSVFDLKENLSCTDLVCVG